MTLAAINGILALALECAAIAIVATGAYRTMDQPVVRWIAPIVAVAVLAGLWSHLAAPNSAVRLSGLSLVAFKTSVFVLAAAVLRRLAGPSWALGYGVVAAVQLALATSTGRL